MDSRWIRFRKALQERGFFQVFSHTKRQFKKELRHLYYIYIEFP